MLRNTEQEVKDLVFKDLSETITDINTTSVTYGRIAKGAVLAMKIHVTLCWGDHQKAKDATQVIISLGRYELDSDYTNLLKLAGVDSREIILVVQCKSGTRSLGTIGQLYDNSDDGWSSVVSIRKCVDNYEMSDGTTIAEAGPGYNTTHLFHGRDPYMAMTIFYPSCDWEGSIFNTLDENANGKKNPNCPTNAVSSFKTAFT